ncbi:MHC class I polypeptide-related sequence B-like [Pan paniscus]|uniref:MHC class I polypeptide-related sequence B-like n=1 Tax=Pan paniscus TaxID=9597 RepID=UPI0030052B5D
MEMSLVLLFLTRTALFAPQGAAAEPHSLCYNLTVLSRDGSVQSGFLAEGHLDGQLFLLCDRQKGRAGPRGQWAEAVLGAETWDTETEDLTENGQELRRTLAHIKGQKGGRLHAKAMVISEILEVSEKQPAHPGELPPSPTTQEPTPTTLSSASKLESQSVRPQS